MIKETIEMPSGDVEISLNALDELTIQMKAPKGVAERVGRNEPEDRDIVWFEQVVDISSDVDISMISNKEALFIIDHVFRRMDDMDVKTYDEFVGEMHNTDFLSEGTLGVQ